MFSGLLSDAKEKAVTLNRSGSPRGDDKSEISPLSPIPAGAHFRLHLSSAAVLHSPHFVKIKRLQVS